MATINLGSWNCNNGCDAADDPFDFYTSDLQVTLAGLDLLFLQEVPFVDGLPDSRLLGVLDSVGLIHRVWSLLDDAHNREAGVGSGLTTASRSSVVRGETRRFRNPQLSATVDGQEWDSHDKGALAVRVLLPDAELVALNVHLLPYQSFGHLPSDDLPMRSWRELESMVGALLEDSPRLIVAGDFNRTETQLVKLHSLVHGEATRTSGESHDNIFTSDTVPLAAMSIRHSPSDHFILLGEAICQP